MDSTGDVTRLLQQVQQGDGAALDRLFPRVYDELHRMAHGHLEREYGARTLRTTDLVHEAYLKLVGPAPMPFESRAHFFGAAARAMRQILVDYARRRQALKRGGDVDKVALDDTQVQLEAKALAVDACAETLIEVDEALMRLAALSPRLSQVVECRFFGGLSVDETAAVMGTSPRTVKRDWRKARAWLHRALQAAADGPTG